MICKTHAFVKSFSTYSTSKAPSWIEARAIGMKIRQALTNEWALRGISQKDHFIKLSNHISLAAFEMTPHEMRTLKGILSHQSLRDHMNEMELTLIQLAEVSTIELIKQSNPIGFKANYDIAGMGGEVAGVARRVFEKQSGMKVCNYSSDVKKIA